MSDFPDDSFSHDDLDDELNPDRPDPDARDETDENPASPSDDAADDADEPSPDEPTHGDEVSQVHHQPVSARVPSSIAAGVFSTGAIVLTGKTEFILDFALRLARPHQIAARVILPPPAVPAVVHALRQSIERYEQRFGEIPSLPRVSESQQNITPEAVKDAYEEMRTRDEVFGGAYANGVVITSSAAEFCFDFFANFFPTSTVTSRVYLAAPHAPRLADSLENAWRQYEQRGDEPA